MMFAINVILCIVLKILVIDEGQIQIDFQEKAIHMW